MAGTLHDQLIAQRIGQLQKLCAWRRNLGTRRMKLERLEQSVKQMRADLAEEENKWVAEADALRDSEAGGGVMAGTADR